MSLHKIIFFTFTDIVNVKIGLNILLCFDALKSVKLIPKNNIASLKSTDI